MPGGRKGVIVGVVKDFNFRSLHEVIEPMVMFIQPEKANIFSVRIQPQNTGATLDKLRATWYSLAPDRPFVYSFLNDDFAAFYQAEQRLSRVFAAFAVIAIFVASLGLFGLAAFAFEQRTKEIGIRKVLGASVASLLSLLSKDFVKLVLLATLIAWPVAYFAMNKWL
jgi:putative ABC transport system permease protein